MSGNRNGSKNNSVMRTDCKIAGPLLAVFSGVLFLLYFSCWTSPVMKGSYGYDSALFSMIGRAIVNGKVMYRDYFDIKGPVFFFWEALGQFICTGRIGINILQLICITAATLMLYRICKMYGLTGWQTVFVFFSVYYVYATTLWGGNSVEEFCLPLNFACMYYGLRYLKGIKRDLNISFFFGLCFGVMALSKVTVASPMCAVVLVIVIDMICKKDFKALRKCALLFIAGIMVIAIPVFVYFYAKGALGDMLNCVFRIAFARGTDYYEGFSVKWEVYLTACYVGIIYWFIRFFGKKDPGYDKWILLSLIVVIYISMHFGTPFDYYFTSTLPIVALLAILHCADVSEALSGGFDRRPKKTKVWMLRCFYMSFGGIFVIFIAYSGSTNKNVMDDWKILTQDSEYGYYNDCIAAYEAIPEDEREDLFCIESGMIFYEVNHILPRSRYPVNMPYFCELYEPAEEEIMDTIENHTPKWIVSKQLDILRNEKIKNAVYSRYERVLDNSMQELWRRID